MKQGLALKSSQDEIIIPGLFFLFFITQLILFEIYSTQVKKNIIRKLNFLPKPKTRQIWLWGRSLRCWPTSSYASPLLKLRPCSSQHTRLETQVVQSSRACSGGSPLGQSCRWMSFPSSAGLVGSSSHPFCRQSPAQAKWCSGQSHLHYKYSNVLLESFNKSRHSSYLSCL